MASILAVIGEECLALIDPASKTKPGLAIIIKPIPEPDEFRCREASM